MPTTLDSVCPLDCPDTCSLSVTVDDGRITKVDGSRAQSAHRRLHLRQGAALSRSASTRRCACCTRSGASGRKARGASSASAGTRRSTPSRSASSRSSPRTGRRRSCRITTAARTACFGEGATDARFFNRLGASELLKTVCAAPTGTAYRAMFGTMGGVPPEDYRLARAIILWGVNPSATSIHLVPQVNAARRAGRVRRRHRSAAHAAGAQRDACTCNRCPAPTSCWRWR